MRVSFCRIQWKKKALVTITALFLVFIFSLRFLVMVVLVRIHSIADVLSIIY